MISVAEAKAALLASIPELGVEVIVVTEADRRFTAAPINAPYDHPLFDQSAVDGYAFGWDPTIRSWELVGQVPAGSVLPKALLPGQCARILTGAKLPAGADTVVMQEFVHRTGAHMEHQDGKLRLGANVRKQGEQVAQGGVVLGAGACLSPQAIGLLRSVGVSTVPCGRAPRIGIVITGDEFAEAAGSSPGRIFSSNGEMLQAALRAEGLPSTLMHAPDDMQVLGETLRAALQQHDLVITTGGVSVGDLDLVRPALESLGTRIVFHGVTQKPGKPMLLGRWNETLVLGLPGNPRAVMILFWEFVLPAIRAMQGAAEPWLRSERLPLAHGVELKGQREEFRAAQVRNGAVTLLADQGSHMLASLLHADALVHFTAAQHVLVAQEMVEVHYLPH